MFLFGIGSEQFQKGIFINSMVLYYYLEWYRSPHQGPWAEVKGCTKQQLITRSWQDFCHEKWDSVTRFPTWATLRRSPPKACNCGCPGRGRRGKGHAGRRTVSPSSPFTVWIHHAAPISTVVVRVATIGGTRVFKPCPVVLTFTTWFCDWRAITPVCSFATLVEDIAPVSWVARWIAARG